MLRTLAEKVHPENCAILIVDVQNDFCAEGGAMHREGRDLSLVKAMVPRLANLVDAARDAKVRCIWNATSTTPRRTGISPRYGWSTRSGGAGALISPSRYASRTRGTVISFRSGRCRTRRS